MHRHALILSLLLCACGDDDDGGGRDAGAHDSGTRDSGTRDSGTRDSGMRDASMAGDAASGHATSLFLEGMAEGSADEDAGSDRVECRFSAVIDQLDYEANGDFTGFGVGELFRTTYVDDNVSEFIPLIGGEVTLSHTSDTAIELRFVGDQPDNALEFWKELEVITGVDRGNGRYDGSWLCAPGLLGDPGFMDIDLTVPGEWTMEPGP